MTYLGPLAKGRISIFAISTYDTDYVMVKGEKLEEAVKVLSAAGHNVRIDEAGTGSVQPAYTPTQGQYLAFIYYYTKLNGVPPAEADFQRYFKVSPPSVHQMIVMLEKRGFIQRTPGVGRSIRLRLSREQLPDLL